MSDPFTISPPAWLERVAKPVDGTELGKSLGMSLMSLANSFSRDPDASPDAGFFESRKGIDKGFAEVTNDQIDPQWRVKGQLMANQVLEQKAQLAAQGALAEERRKETSAWMEDAPKLAPWITATPEERKGMAAPIPGSKMGMQALQKQSLADQKYYTDQDKMNTQIERAKIQAARDAHITDRVAKQSEALAAVDDDSVVSAIQALPYDKSGVMTTAQLEILNRWRRSKNMTDLGVSASEYLQKPGKNSEREVQLQDLRADEADLRRRIDAKAKNNEPTDDLESELADVKAQRKALAGGKSVQAPSASPEAKYAQSAVHELNAAISSGKKDVVKSVTEKIRADQQTLVRDKSGKILSKDPIERDQVLAQLKPGTWIYDPTRSISDEPNVVTGISGQVTQEIIDAAKQSVSTRKAQQEKRDKEKAKARKETVEQMGSNWQRMGTMGGL